MTMKIKLKIKNRSQIYVIGRPRPRHGHKYHCTKNEVFFKGFFSKREEILHEKLHFLCSV